METVIRQPWMTDEDYEWYQFEEQARLNTLKRRNREGNGALICIKAQHPLNADGTPGAEYEARLKKALAVKAECEARGMHVRIMTFGGIHEGHKTISLAEAGKSYLIANGVDERIIESVPIVYSGNDEDDLSARRFSELGDEFSELHVVLSAGQFDRARLFYIFCGWLPEMHVVNFIAARPHHSTICELRGAWGVPSFTNPKDIEEATAKVRNRHLADAMNNQ